MKSPLLAYRRLWSIAIVILVLDQATKLAIDGWLPLNTYHAYSGPQEPVEVIPGFFYIVHIVNKGAAWGIFAGYTQILALLGLVAIGAIFFFREALGLKRPFMQVAFGLLIGGIIGNMIDRLAYGHVVDFLDFHFGSYRYPAFNIADCGITIGVGLYLIATLLEGKQADTPPPASPK